MLSNLETEDEKLIQIILLGQPELKKKLTHPRLEQFSQRIVVYYHLGSLDREETEDYIRHRLKKSGCVNDSLFTEWAIDEIYEYSKGIPRLINLACHNALINGLVSESKFITASHVTEATQDLMYGLGHAVLRKAEEKLAQMNLDYRV